jgi:hypothetical protein
MRDLELATTEELLEEVSKRVDAFVFLGYTDRTADSYALFTETKGSTPEILGLSWMLRDSIEEIVTTRRSRPMGGEP